MRAHISASFFLILVITTFPAASWGLASNNVPLDSPVYAYIEKLYGFGVIDGSMNGLKPFSKAEAARLLLEAEANINRLSPGESALALQIIKRLRELVPREACLYSQEDEAPGLDWNPVSNIRLRYVFFEGRPRSFNRLVNNPGGEGFFGIGHLGRKFGAGNTAIESGAEGTPLMENNEGIVYGRGHNFELRWSAECYVKKYLTVLVEPLVLSRPEDRRESPFADIRLNKGYLKLGGKGLELEVGRDSVWFGQGFRGTTVLTDNARNFDLVKVSSPEPVRWRWLRRKVGLVKYALFLSRAEASGSGPELRRPWIIGFKLAVKPHPNFEIGGNYARQLGGPNTGFSGSVTSIFLGGEQSDGSNTLAGLDVRLRLPWLLGTTLYWEYMGEDNYGIFPFVESHVFGVFVPRLTRDGRNDLRVEVFIGNKVAYTSGQYPEGFTNGDMVMGHSQGGDTKDYFARFTHYFSARNRAALEYFHTQRGRLGRLGDEKVEEKDAGRVIWELPFRGDWDLLLCYGYENIRNFNLTAGDHQENHVLRLDLRYLY